MTQYVLTTGSDFSTTPAAASQNINWDVPTNPILKNDLTATASVVCYEIHNDNSSLTNQDSGNGVSESGTYNTLNRIYPNDTSVASYLSNLENTPGHRIKCYDSHTTTGQDLSSLSLTTVDYFVMIFADDYKKHHFARIKEITTDDVAGDSFEFEPQYAGEIPKNTKFTIFKGPPIADTSVIALMYGGQGSGSGSDSRHDIYTNCVRPLFYFYNDRLDKDNQLNHNTKYSLYYSRWNGSSHASALTHFVTEQDYGMEVKDYSPYSTTATLVDTNRSKDTPSTSGGAIERYGSSSETSYTNNYAGWNTCFKNIQRTTDNKIASSTSGSFTGPTRYIHYGTSAVKNNFVPRVMDASVFQSITRTGTYFEASIIDPHRIMGSKLQRFDRVRIRNTIAEGKITLKDDAALFGEVTGTSGTTTFTFSKLSKNQDLRVILKNQSSDFETIRIGNYHYQISAIAAPAYGTGTATIEQVVTVSHHRLNTAATFTAGNIQETVSGTTAYRQRWGKVTNTLLVDFEIDTEATHANADSRDIAATALSYNGTALTDFSESRINGLELVLMDGEYTGHRLSVNYGDSVNGYVKITEPRSTMYQKESLSYPNILDFFNGTFLLDKIIFSGTVENIEEKIEHGAFTYVIHGRNDISKLLGPIVNKNLLYSKDWIYSTQIPFTISASGTTAAADINVGSTSITTAHSSVINVGDLLFGPLVSSTMGALNPLIGRVKSVGGTTVTLEEGSLVFLASGQALNRQTSHDYISYGKAIQSSPSASETATSLRGTANKGLYFDSGLKLTRVLGAPETDGAKLAETSCHSDSKARGYYINSPVSIIDDTLPFMSRLSDELSASLTHTEVNTVSSITNFNVVSIDSQENDTVIELAPNCPAVLARVDNNPQDTRFNTLIDSGMDVKGAVSKGSTGRVLIDGTNVNSPSTVYAYLGRGKPVYKSDGTLIGVVERIEVSDYTAATAVITEWEVLFDRPLHVALGDNEDLYVSSTNSQGNYNHGIYFLNTQGLGTGGILHMVNSEYSTSVGGRTPKPIPYSFQHHATIDGTIDGGIGTVMSNIAQFGIPTFRYIDLQKGGLGSAYFNFKALLDGGNKSNYSRNRGNVTGYATSFKSIWGRRQTRINANSFLPSWSAPYGSSVTSRIRTHQYSHEQRGNLPAHSSAFGDFEIYNSAALTPALNLMPHYHDASDGGDGSDWASTTGTDRIEGYRENAIARARDSLEIIDPKMARWFIFAPGDVWPDSMARQHHIGYSARDLTDYSIILRGKLAKEATNISHQNYLGEFPREITTDNSFEVLDIKESSITGNQIKRTGLMRLRELTFDWHFNAVDPELPPDAVLDAVDSFDYTVFMPVKNAQFYSSSGNNVTISDVSEYNSAKTVITTSNNNGSGGNIFDTNDRLYTTDGRYLGTVSSASTTAITLASKVKMIDGQLYTGGVYKLEYTNQSGTSNPPWRSTKLHGRAGQSSLWNVSVSSPKALDMLQGAILNGNHPNGGTSTFWDNNWGTSADLSSLDAIIMPPLFSTGGDADFHSPLATTQNAIYTSSAQDSGHYKIHPSALLELLFNEGFTGPEVYRGCKAVSLGRFDVENKGEWEVGLGSIVDLSNTVEKITPGGTNEWTFFHVETEMRKHNGSAVQQYSNMNADFAEQTIQGSSISVSTPDTRIDGMRFVLKPILHMGDGTGTITGGTAYDHTHEHNRNIQTWEFDLSDNATNNSDNYWLRFCPNLTGCYLVGTEAFVYGTNTLNSADTGGFEGTWVDSQSGGSYSSTVDIGKAAAVSMEGTHPNKMHYIISHTVSTSGSGQKHYLTVDNCGTLVFGGGAFKPSQFYRVMQPAETCFWPNSPTSIDLYKMSSKYTKRPDSDEMYGDIAHISMWEKGNIYALKDEYGYNEAVQSMYVIVEMDGGDGDMDYIVPRKYEDVFGVSKKFEDPKSYDVLLNDGNSQSRKTMFVEKAASSIRNCRLTFSDSFDKMAGIVSIGEIFTVKTPLSPKIKNPEVANIGSSVTICQEAEQIINDLLEEEDIDYTKTTNSYPYFMSPDFRGTDLYSAIDLIASFKKKRIIITPDGIKLRPDTLDLDYTGITFTSSNNDIRIIDISRNDSLFDRFNEVIVYGKGVKATRRDRQSINKIGKKTLEEVDDTLITQQEVNERASQLLFLHSEDNQRITLKCGNSGVELIRPGDIVNLDFPEHRIVAGEYLILEIKHNLYDVIELELGKYNKGLSERFAELLAQQKKTSAYLRANKFKTAINTSDFFDKFSLKELRLKIERTASSGSPFTIGFNYAIDTISAGGTNTGAPIGFNTSLGSVTKTVELDEDLT